MPVLRKRLAPHRRQTQMRKGALEFAILLALERGKEAYASDILNTLRLAQLSVTEGTLYPLLGRLRAGGLIAYQPRPAEAAPPRKYYSLTAKGRSALKELATVWRTLSASLDSLDS